MSTNYKKLGDIVELIDERNKDGKVQNLIGVSIDKCFIKSVANTIGTDLTKYQVIRKNDFACSLMQVSRDGKIPIACLKDYDEAIMSPAYYIFRIKNTNEVLPDYLAMWFMRTEFDREASYIAVGGVRGSMPWEDFCDMKLPVPDLKEQEKIVNTYNSITKRIQLKQKINENLEKTAQCLFEKCKNVSTKQQKLSDFITIKHGYAFEGDYFSLEDNGNILLTPGNFKLNGGFKDDKCKYYTGSIPNNFILSANDLIVTMTDLSKEADTLGYSALIPTGTKYKYLHNQRIGLIQFKNTKLSKDYIYWFMRSFDYHKKVVGSSSGTTVHHTSPDRICEIEIPIIENEKEVSLKFAKLNSCIEKNSREITNLQTLKQILISRISGM